MKVLSAFPPGNLINTVEVCPPKGSNFSKTLDTGQFLYLCRLKKPLGPDKFGTDLRTYQAYTQGKVLVLSQNKHRRQENFSRHVSTSASRRG